MLRGAAAAWLGLVVLQAGTTKAGSGAVGGLLTTVDGLVKRALDPRVAAIPDHSTSSAGTTDSDGNYHPSIPGYLGGGTTTAPGSGTSGQSSNPNYRPYDPPPTGQHNPQYDNPSSSPGGVLEGYQIPWPSVPGVLTA